MVVFDSDIVSPSHLLCGLLFGGKIRKRWLFKKLFKKRAIMSAAVAECLDEAAYVDLNDIRRPRTRLMHKFDGEWLQNLDGTSPDESRHWTALPLHRYKRWWKTHFRRTEDVFNQLFQVLEPHMLDAKGRVDKRYGCTTKRHNVLIMSCCISNHYSTPVVSIKLPSGNRTIESIIFGILWSSKYIFS